VIAEVRLRSRQEFGGAAASINPAKLARLVVRFDALLLTGADSAIEWIEAAFEA
jgi:Holliday junction resolvase-like predicted endonuclease